MMHCRDFPLGLRPDIDVWAVFEGSQYMHRERAAMSPDRFSIRVRIIFEPDPSNAPGPFYVAHGCCLCCYAPEAESPEMVGPNARITILTPRDELDIPAL